MGNLFLDYFFLVLIKCFRSYKRSKSARTLSAATTLPTVRIGLRTGGRLRTSVRQFWDTHTESCRLLVAVADYCLLGLMNGRLSVRCDTVLTSHVIVNWIKSTMSFTSVHRLVSTNVCVVKATRCVCNVIIITVTSTLQKHPDVK